MSCNSRAPADEHKVPGRSSPSCTRGAPWVSLRAETPFLTDVLTDEGKTLTNPDRRGRHSKDLKRLNVSNLSATSVRIREGFSNVCQDVCQEHHRASKTDARGLRNWPSGMCEARLVAAGAAIDTPFRGPCRRAVPEGCVFQPVGVPLADHLPRDTSTQQAANHAAERSC